MVKEFSYTSNSGTKNRRVFVTRENSHYVEGIDLSLLDVDSANTIINMYKDFVPVNDCSDAKVQLDNFNPSWNKAYRKFAKCKINS